MIGVLIKRGNLETGTYTGRMPCEDGDYAAPSQGTTRSWERGLEQILPSALRRSQCCRHLDAGLPASRTVRQNIFYFYFFYSIASDEMNLYVVSVYTLRFFFNSNLLFIYLFLYFLFLAVLGLRFCARASSSCGKRGPLFIVVRGSLTVAASLVAEHRLQMRRLSSCGSRA